MNCQSVVSTSPKKTLSRQFKANMDSEAGSEGGLRTDQEHDAAGSYARLFAACPDSLELKLAHFAKYARRQDMTRLLARYEIFKRALHVKGSIVECGVYRGAGLMSWANFSAILEPNNLTRRIYGFDSFAGFPAVSGHDATSARQTRQGDLYSDCFEELTALIAAYDQNRFLGHVPKVELVRGDATQTIPAFIESHPHVVIGLLFLDFDLYEPTKAALEHLVPRMPKGAVIAFDELDNPAWPGETMALFHANRIAGLRLGRLDFDPYVGFAIID
jgi:Macrocin-O-methyltransferase (TylF)